MRVPGALRLDRRRFVITALIVLTVTVVAIARSGPLVPRHIRILAGPEGSTYYTDAVAYAEVMRRHGVTAEVVETNGSLDNLRLITQAKGSQTVAMAETGLEVLAEDLDTEGLVSLGSVQAIPFWLFVRKDLEIEDEEDLHGRLIVPGEAGSAVRVVVSVLLKENGLPGDILASPLAEIPAEDIREVLEAGDADAAFVVGSPGSPAIDELLRSEIVAPVSMRRAQAYDRRYQRLGIVTLPEGAFDLARNIPSEDLTLLTSALQIVATEELSAMLVDLMLDTAQEVHGGVTLFTEQGDFPTPKIASLPLSPAAQRFYTDGPSPLRRWLPFWAATLLNRFALVAAAVLGAAFTLVNVLPTLRAVPFNMKLGRVYRQLESIEKRMGDTSRRDDLLAELDELIELVHTFSVPRGMLPPYFEMRQNIHDLRERVAGQSG